MTAPVSQSVVHAVAREEGVDPVDLTAPLNDVVDPDALDVLFRNGSGSIRFTYLDYEVTVDHSGRVEVVPVLEH